jgi:signal transduction histidine kinase
MNPRRWRLDMREPPHWWPNGEPWPPRSSRYWSLRRRDRFVRRSGWFTFWPLWLISWFTFISLRWRPFGNAPQETPWAITSLVPILLMCAVAAGGVAVIIRRIAGPVADIVGAAERIARRDYRVRVDEPTRGPRWVADTARAFNAMAAELDAQDVARRHLMADIAHELRTPLAVVQARLEGVIDGVYPASSEELQGVLDNARVVSRLVEDLRTLSNAESGALALAKEPTDIVALADDVASSLEDRAAQAGVTLQVDADSGSDLEAISIDPIRIREVLLNLVSNALRYTTRGGRVTIRITSPTGAVQVDVVDTGAGIPADEIPRIFDRFYKGAGSTGSGLGLTIARRLVEAHGGSIRADSQPGVGTTMTFTLPV